MTAPAPASIPLVLDETHLIPSDASAVVSGAGVAVPDVVVFDVSGPGAVGCVQGLLTSDIEKAADNGCVYGAVLTPKGMIQTDVWATRRGGEVRLCAPSAGRGALADVLSRSLPPRLARYVEVTGRVEVLRLIGPRAVEAAGRAGLPLPEMGRAATAEVGGTPLVVIRPSQEPAPFALEIQSDRDAKDVRGRLAQAGAMPVTEAALELSRVLVGWPRLGAEIDEKTLPQEVRFDEVGGVSYTKGCYVGQETVARLHFRGHANRGLVGLEWGEAPEPANAHVVQDDRTVGTVTTAVWVEPWGTWVGLAKVRRELDRTRGVIAAGAPAAIVTLPFGLRR
ncbi:MAG TPA: hypothetical protein VNL18_00485 [Gemmatimonadales bacterium]|nr:hypothetical protein [Gemmatimonadales bacterium]